jgi:hypothetical protein
MSTHIEQCAYIHKSLHTYMLFRRFSAQHTFQVCVNLYEVRMYISNLGTTYQVQICMNMYGICAVMYVYIFVLTCVYICICIHEHLHAHVLLQYAHSYILMNVSARTALPSPDMTHEWN